MAEVLFQIKRELITEHMHIVMPFTVKSKKPLSWWIDNNFAALKDLEIVTD